MDAVVEALLATHDVDPAVRAWLGEPVQPFIDGAFRGVVGGTVHAVHEPSTGGLLTHVPECGQVDVDAAVGAAQRAMRGAWGALKPNARQNMLLRLADLIERDAAIIGAIETIDNGKALGPCIDMDVLGSADLLRYMAGWATKLDGATRPVSAAGEHVAMTLKEPVGVVAAIVPWNWPFNMAMWKIAAPLAAGCSVVLKPDVKTSLSVMYLARLAVEAGLPAGALNIVTGDGATIGAMLVEHPGVAKVSFTGSTVTGRVVGAAAGRALKPMTLELGGKSAMIAFADADIDALVAGVQWSIFFNAGQVCSGGSRLYVDRSIVTPLLEALVDLAEGMTLACGLDPACDMGPLISREQQARVLGFIERARAEGVMVAAGGAAGRGDGWFVRPTVLVAPDNASEAVREEIFGPVLTVVPFDDPADAIALANDSDYALGASVWTRDVSRALAVARALDAGSVWVNAHDLVDSAMPFGGFKQSGHGKDMGAEQIATCLRTKALWIAL